MPPAGTTKTKIIAIVNPGATQQQITTTLGNQPEFDLMVEFAELASKPEQLVRELQGNQVDLILIDHELQGQSSLDLINDLALQFPQLEIIAILPEGDPLLAQQVMLAGAHAFLIQPFTQVNLLSTLRRMRDLQGRRRQIQSVQDISGSEAQLQNRMLAVFSPRGGVGTTTTALNLAISLADETNARVLLLEGKLFFGHLDVMLNIRSRNSLADLIPHANALDEILLNEVITEHISGIQVLLAPGDVQFAQGIRPQDLFNVVASLQRMFDFIVIDAGSTLNENTVTMMDAAGRILLVANPDLAALHDVSRFMRVSQSLAYPAEKILLILNRSGIEGGVKTKDIEAVLHQTIFAEIPDDQANAIRSLNRGIPLVVNYPRSPASRGFKDLAKKMVQMTRDSSAVHATNQPAAREAG